MAHTGLGYYYNQAGLSSGDLKFYFDFNTSGNKNSSLVENSFDLYGNSGSFWDQSGSGYFSGTLMSINDISFESNFCSILLINNKITTGKSILLSNLKTGTNGISGFIFGVNDANKLYLTCYDTGNSEYITNTTSFSLGRNNGISLVKNNNIFSIGKFNFFEKHLYSEQYSFPFNCNTSFGNLYVGGGSGLPNGIYNDYFIGYLDELALIDQNINESSIETLFKGFYKNEPVLQYILTGEYDSYTYSNLNNITSPIWEEMQSGALDYIRTNIFNTTGIGTIKVTNSGLVINGTGYVSGNLSGTVSLQTGKYEITTGNRVTGYSSSGQIAVASGITGYVDINLYPITVFTSGNIYQLTAKSGISGVTEWQSVFSGPLYESYTSTGFISETVNSAYSLNFSYVITGMTGNATYLHIADYSNNGNDDIVISHDLKYTGQGANFRAFKRTQLDYQSVFQEQFDDYNYINQFKLDGITLLFPVRTGDTLELFRQDYSGFNSYNKNYGHSLASGLFGYTGDLDTDNIYFFANGIYQHPNRLYEDVWLQTGIDILYSGSDSWITNSSFSGDYDLNNGYFVTEKLFDRNDVDIIDNASGLNIIKNKQYVTGSQFISGYGLMTGLSGNSNSLFFINGVKLLSGTDYSYDTGTSIYKLINNNYSGTTGIMFAVTVSGTGNIPIYYNSSGISKNSVTGLIPERGSLLFYNGLRQNLNIDYLETSSLDLIYNLTGFYETNTEQILNK